MFIQVLKATLVTVAISSSLVHSANASTVILDFNGVSSGSFANSDQNAQTAGISFDYAVFLPLLDSYNTPILGSDHWTVDDTAPPVTVVNGANLSGDYADSTGLDAREQPVLMHFGGISNVASFSLNASTYDGQSFDGYYNPALEFLDVNGNSIGSAAFTQVAGIFSASLSIPLQGVRDVLLAGGAIYDNVSFGVTAVPVPGALWLFGSALAGIAGLRRRTGTKRRKMADGCCQVDVSSPA